MILTWVGAGSRLAYHAFESAILKSVVFPDKRLHPARLQEKYDKEE